MKHRRLRSFARQSMCDGVGVGSVHLSQPILTASGTAGHGVELGKYFDMSQIGATVVKSLFAEQWPGNPAPRVHPAPAGMINAVGLQGPGIAAWAEHDLPQLEQANTKVVASIWGRSIQEYAQAAQMMAVLGKRIIALEVNLSCPNLEDRGGIISHDALLSAEVINAVMVECRLSGIPIWAKLSPNTDRVIEVASAVVEAGAEALTLVNTLLGLLVDPETAKPVLGNGGGGLSGRAIHPVALRTVYDVRKALSSVPIVGVGGVSSGAQAIAMMQVGASAVQVGTASFARPDAPMMVLNQMHAWAKKHGVTSWSDVINQAHR